MEFSRIHGGRMNKLQDAADTGRIGGILRAIVGGGESFQMESLRDGDLTITDGHSIHKLITAFFAKWFQRLPSERDRDKLLADCVLANDRSAWDRLIDSVGIPSSVSDTLWLAFQPKKISDEGLIDANNLAHYCPSFEEFNEYIDRLDSNSAPGASGLSYAMIKLWPDSLLRRAYDLLRDSWIKKTIPVGWSFTHLCSLR
jgi:hypothetical protein